MAARNDDSLLFVAEWFDPMPMIRKKYLLKYFTDQHMVEMIDVKSRKMFLKKSVCPPEISREDFFVGSKILLYSRELEIVDYGDSSTKQKLHHQIQQCMVLMTASSYKDWGHLITDITSENMTMVCIKSFIHSPNIADSICDILHESQRCSSDFSEGVSLALMLHGENGFDKLNSLAQKNSSSGRTASFYYAKNGEESAALNALLFNRQYATTATFDSCSCCIIKPHAVKTRLVGPIIAQLLLQGYEISAVRSLTFQRVQAEEFLEVYKGVISDFGDHVGQLCIGMSVALEIRAENAVNTLRETAGPWDVELAKELRPNTLRGQFGIDRVLSAIHCTDLPQDGVPECEYVFKIL